MLRPTTMDSLDAIAGVTGQAGSSGQRQPEFWSQTVIVGDTRQPPRFSCTDASVCAGPQRNPMTTQATRSLPDYAPIPESSLGPALNEQGYHFGRVERN